MIPVLICPVINRFDLLERMLSSIDYPVRQILVIDNSCSGYEVPEGVTPYPLFHIRPFTPMGYGGAINFGITQTAYAPYWMWSSNDVEFHPGHLQTVADRMGEATAPRIVTGGFTWAAVNKETIDVVGLVDDWSFFPVYYDDNDYQYRCKLAGVDWIEDWSTGSNHGEGALPGSMVINSDEQLRRKNNLSFRENERRYLAKWGGPPRSEVFKSPYNSRYPVWYTKPDVKGRADRMW